MGKKKSKNFVLDTNILLGSGVSALYGFDDNTVYLTGTTLQELDSKKTVPGEIGHNARAVIRELDRLREAGDLRRGVPVGKGICRIEADEVFADKLPPGFSIQHPDNRIIAACIGLAYHHPLERFILVTNDISMRINADQCFKYSKAEVGIESYQNDRISSEEEYLGYIVDEAADPEYINRLYRDGNAPLGKYRKLVNLQFAILKCGKQSALAVRMNDRMHIIKDQTCFGIKKTYNAAQRMCLWSLLAPVEQVPLVIIKGPAGTGKTLLALAAGIDQTYEGNYNKVLIGRSNVENRNEQSFGYLPGSLEEKMSSLILPFTDNLECLLRKDVGSKESNDQIKMQIEDLLATVIELNPLVYIRGRSISHSYIVVDEAQNTSRAVIRDVITRAGLKSKVVIMGDPSQIDAPTLDKFTCGLNVAYQKMRGVAAEIEFTDDESVRSELAKAALKLMK